MPFLLLFYFIRLMVKFILQQLFSRKSLKNPKMSLMMMPLLKLSKHAMLLRMKRSKLPNERLKVKHRNPRNEIRLKRLRPSKRQLNCTATMTNMMNMMTMEHNMKMTSSKIYLKQTIISYSIGFLRTFETQIHRSYSIYFIVLRYHSVQGFKKKLFFRFVMTINY